jgi:hypothetical protein
MIKKMRIIKNKQKIWIKKNNTKKMIMIKKIKNKIIMMIDT